MKNAIILHGTGETPESFWYRYIQANLTWYNHVWLPQLPDKDKPTLIIAHSAGVPLALSVIECLDIKIKQMVLVAGFIEPLKEGVDGPNFILQEKYNWDKIKSNVDDVILIHSDNDPWGCDHAQGLKMFNKLGGKLVIMHGQGHFGSNTFNQPYKEFPFLVRLID